MEDELLNGGSDFQNQQQELGDEVFVPSPEEAGYPVTELGFIANMEARTDANQKKSDAAANMHEASALVMDVLEATVLRGASLLLRVNVTPTIANCPKLTWESSDSSVAVVDDMIKGNGIKEDGLAQLFACGVGEATITATSESGLRCSMSLEVVESLPEQMEVGSKYVFTTYDAEGVSEVAQGELEVMSSEEGLAEVKVLSIDPDDPEHSWVNQVFYVDSDIAVGDGEKHLLYSDVEKTAVPEVSIAIVEKAEAED